MSAGMAAARPAAVLTRASEMPGATAAIDVDPVWPMARKDCMMPQTVPKRPMKGHAEAVVARKVMCRVRRETSTPIALSKARSTPEMFLISSFPADWTAGGCMAIVVTGDSGQTYVFCENDDPGDERKEQQDAQDDLGRGAGLAEEDNEGVLAPGQVFRPDGLKQGHHHRFAP